MIINHTFNIKINSVKIKFIIIRNSIIVKKITTKMGDCFGMTQYSKCNKKK